jgi:Glycosyl transferase family 2
MRYLSNFIRVEYINIMFTYSISVLAIFKNESSIIAEWINHYMREGVEHFYLIDNGSTDDINDTLSRYSNITLIKDDRSATTENQTFLMNHYYLNTIKNETEWIIICDVDEYIYARNRNVQILDVLNKLPTNVEKIWIPWKCFGTNGYIIQPKGIIWPFTKRSAHISAQMEHGKVICRTQNLIGIVAGGSMVELSENNVYYLCNGQRLDQCKSNDRVFHALSLHLNHYMHMTEFNNMDETWISNMDEICNAVEDDELAQKTHKRTKK